MRRTRSTCTRNRRNADDLELAGPRGAAGDAAGIDQRLRPGAHHLRITPAPLPAGNLCGRSYLALASGKPLPKKEPWRTTVFAQTCSTAMARTDRYKLVMRNDGKGPGELV